MTHTPTDALRLVPDDRVRELAMQLAKSIAGLGYPVGMGLAPPEAVCMKAAQGIFDTYLAAAPASPLPEGGGWQDISTAPKDGTPILAWCVHPHARWSGDDRDWAAPVVTSWTTHNGGGWTWHGMIGTFTHWMTLPDAPTGAK